MSDRQLIADLLSALEYHTEQTRPIEFSKVAIEAAREYLSKPAPVQQEPVAWLATDCIGERYLCFSPPLDNDQVLPLYTTPPQRKQLTDEQADSILNGLRTCLHLDSKRMFLKTWLRDWAAHGIKGEA